MIKYTSLILAFIFYSQVIAQVDKPNIPLTKISFEQTEFNFGEISEGENIQNVYTFTNTGDVPLILTNVKGSCGCTVPEWPKAPILPGESSQLLVQFNSKNKKGNQTKRVTITSNTDPVQSFLVLKGKVISEKDSESPSSKDESKPYELSGALSPNSINIYPNPTSDFVNIDLREYKSKSATIDIFNSLGQRTVSNLVDRIEDKVVQINLHDFKSGTYVASIKIDGMNRLAKQFVVLRN